MQDKWEQCKVIRIWPEIIEKMKEDFAITDRTFHAFLEPLTISSVENDIIRICCPGGVFAIEFFQKMYYLPIKVTVEEVLERPYEIEFICEEEEKDAFEEKKRILLHWIKTARLILLWSVIKTGWHIRRLSL